MPPHGSGCARVSRRGNGLQTAGVLEGVPAATAMLWHHCITPIQSAPLRVCCRRGTYYTRAWQAVVARAQGQQHVVQPNTFALQLPHEGAYSRHEASLAAFEAVGACLETGLPPVGCRLLVAARCCLLAAGGRPCGLPGCDVAAALLGAFCCSQVLVLPPLLVTLRLRRDPVPSVCPLPLQVEPVFQQLLQEVGAGGYLPVTSFPERCSPHAQPAASAA